MMRVCSEVYVCSLGGALATMMAFDFAHDRVHGEKHGLSAEELQKLHSKPMLYTFGQPRVFATLPNRPHPLTLVPNYYRAVNFGESALQTESTCCDSIVAGDPVPEVPQPTWTSFVVCGYTFAHGGRLMQFNQGGLLVVEPNLFEGTAGHVIDPNQHHGHVYESNIERYLQRRRKWLWRKAIYTSWMCASLTLE